MTTKTKTVNDSLVDAIRERDTKQTPHNGGILLADQYVSTVKQCVGLDACYKYASNRNESFSDVIKRARGTLTYNNPEMEVSDIYSEQVKNNNRIQIGDDEIVIPKNTLMVFRHVLTSPKKDRDNDILRTEGAEPDPKMLLLWQHIHTLPIGKMLGIVEHTKDRMEVISAVVDMNDLANDAAKMIDNGMGRYSHGFKALEFEKIKGENGAPSGFDIKRFEIMEESLVSVPSNTDADTLEVIADMFTGGKFSSSVMKETGKSAVSTLKRAQGIGFTKVEEEDDAESKQKGCSCGGGGSESEPQEASSSAEENVDAGAAGKSEDSEDDKMKCPKCGAELDKDGECSKCGKGKDEPKDDDEEEKDKSPTIIYVDVPPEEADIEAKDALKIFLSKGTLEDYRKAITAIKTLVSIRLEEKKAEEMNAIIS